MAENIYCGDKYRKASPYLMLFGYAFKKTRFIFTAILVSLIVVYFVIFRNWNKEHPYLVFEPIPINEKHATEVVREVICIPNAEICFKVVDYKNINNKYTRRLMVETVDDVVLSASDLISPPGEYLNSPNSQNWLIRKDKLNLEYTKIIIAQMYATGTVTPSSNLVRVLIIGLGGASIPNFLNENSEMFDITSVDIEPAIDYIAEKWFNLEKSKRQHIIVEDGVKFVKEYKNWEPKFDVIIIDACVTKPESDSGNICPIEPFYTDKQLIASLWKMTASNGVIIVNSFATSNGEKVEKLRQNMFELYHEELANSKCYFVVTDDISNSIFTCTLALRANEQMSKELYDKRIVQLPDVLRKELELEVKIVNPKHIERDL